MESQDEAFSEKLDSILVIAAVAERRNNARSKTLAFKADGSGFLHSHPDTNW